MLSHLRASTRQGLPWPCLSQIRILTTEHGMACYPTARFGRPICYLPGTQNSAVTSTCATTSYGRSSGLCAVTRPYSARACRSSSFSRWRVPTTPAPCECRIQLSVRAGKRGVENHEPSAAWSTASVRLFRGFSFFAPEGYGNRFRLAVNENPKGFIHRAKPWKRFLLLAKTT